MKRLGLLVMPLVAISFLTNCSESKPYKTVKRTVSFNIPDCKMLYGSTEIDSSGTEIELPDISPCYVKFLLKADDNTYMKPSDITLDKTTDYTFDSDSGDLLINVQSDLNITGSCDMYKSLEECTWSQISQISNLGKASDAFSVGDTKTVKVNGLNHKVRIIGFNHDELSTSTEQAPKYASITFEFANVITNSNRVTTTIWDGVYQTSGDNFDYRESIINSFLNNTEDNNSVINMLPSSGDIKNPDLREVIKPVDKKVGVSTDSGHSYIATSFDGDAHPYPYLFLLAHDEITKDRRESYAASNEGTTYEYYKQHDDKNSRIKKVAGLGVSRTYWLRSPRPHPTTHNNSCAWHVSMSGDLFGDLTVYNELFGVAPAFCI
ncbi:MAG: DUF6273 domain-containing protein [Bacilli bacterium]|nr:DUF6273 domain-containing protein [Bacilli bacterium]